MQTNGTQKVALINNRNHIQEKPKLRETGQSEPGLVAFYDIRPGNRAGLFFQTRSQHGPLNT